MIMIVTHQSELREQLSETLRGAGHTVIIPPHRQDMLAVLRDSMPDLIVLDLYVSNPSGAEEWKMLGEWGYQGAVIILSGPSMMPVLKEMHLGGSVHILQVPAKIKGQFQLGELLSTINSCLNQGTSQAPDSEDA